MQTETLKAIINAGNTASKDATRFNLSHILLKAESDKQTITIVATDGHCLSENKVVDAELAELIGERRFLVDCENIPALKQILKQWKTVSIPCVDHGSYLVLGTGLEVKVKEEKESGWTFPDYNYVMPKNMAEYTTEIGVNPAMILSVFKALNLEPNSKGIKIKIRDKMSPIVVEHNGQVGLVMPMRI